VALSGINAEAAKRMGGGKSFGKQSNNVTQQAAPATPAAPAQNAVAPKPGGAPAAAPAAAPKRPWGAMLGGLAAGLGLAWLANSLGMGEALGNMLMFGLLALGVMMAIGWFMRNRRQQPAAQTGSPFAFQGAGNVPVSEPRPYRPENVGNDASARPFERSNLSPLDGSTTGGSMIGSALLG